MAEMKVIDCQKHGIKHVYCEECLFPRDESTPPKPAHIDTTAPVLIRPEDQVRPFASTPPSHQEKVLSRYPKAKLVEDGMLYTVLTGTGALIALGRGTTKELAWEAAAVNVSTNVSTNCRTDYHFDCGMCGCECLCHLTAPTPSPIDTTQGDGVDPCPFCGHEAEETHANDLSYYYVGCPNEDCWVQPETGHFTIEKLAREAWNWKPKPAPQAEAQESFEAFWTGTIHGTVWNIADERTRMAAKDSSRGAWNAQQAKIDALEHLLSGNEEKYKQWHRNIELEELRASCETAEARIAELEALIQPVEISKIDEASNIWMDTAAFYEAANDLHVGELELGNVADFGRICWRAAVKWAESHLHKSEGK